MKPSKHLRSGFLIYSLLVILGVFQHGQGAPGDVDLSFHADLGADGRVNAIAVQPDGKVFIGGTRMTVDGRMNQAIVRLAPDGSTDLSFAVDPNGSFTDVGAIVLTTDGKVLVGYNNGVIRLNSDGSPDVTFIQPSIENDGVYTGVGSIVVQPDGKILIGGLFRKVNGILLSGIARLNVDGSLDTSFTPSGVSDPAHPYPAVGSVALQLDGKVLIGGNFAYVNGEDRRGIARLNADGRLDSSFDLGTGVLEVASLALQPDGKVLIGGTFNNVSGVSRDSIARLNADGSLDASFDPGSGLDGGFAFSIALQPDGKALVAGYFSTVDGTNRNSIARVHADGSLDRSFVPGPGPHPNIAAVAVQSDGKVIFGGFDIAGNVPGDKILTRLYGDSAAAGVVDSSFDGSGVNGTVVAVVAQPDGKVLIGGKFTTVKGLERSGIARLNADGSGDVTFNAGAAVEEKVSALALQSDGKVIVTRCDPVNSGLGSGQNYPPVRLNSDGTVDPTFIPNTEPYPSGSGFTSVLIQPDGKMLLGGYSIEYHVDGEGFIYYYERSLLTRLHTNGAVDSGFTFASGDFNTWIGSVALQADGKVLIGGRFFSVTGVNRGGIARLNANGSLDASFDPGTGVGGYPNWVNSVAVQADGRVLAGGWFSSINGTSRNCIGRLNANGSLDGSFNPGSGANGNVASLVLQPDGKVLIGGDFTTVNGMSRNRIARLNSNGSLDSLFDPGTGVEGSVRAVALQSDGDVLIAGNFQTVNGLARPYVARLHATTVVPPPAPEIAIELPGGTVLIDGVANISFGSTPPSDFVDRTFTVLNSGNAQLTGVNATIIGTNASAFSVTTQPAASVAGPNGSTSFSVRFVPSARGPLSATLHVASNDADENPFDIELSGAGANLAPATAADIAATAYQTAVEIYVLANDSDPDGDVLSITSASAPAHGTAQVVATSSGQRIRYTPASGFFGTDTFTYAISDGFGGTATGTVTVTVAAKTRGKKTVSKGAAVSGAGEPSSGVPAGATWNTFGVPSIGSNGTTTFGATIATAEGVVPLVYAGSSEESEGDSLAPAEYAVAKKGDLAPGVTGATFASFKDPLLNNDGSIVFTATLRGAAPGTNGGIWKRYPGQGAGASTLVAQLGSEPVGVPGARWRTFTSVAVSDGPAGEEVIAFTATMVLGRGAVRTSNDLGLWLADANGVTLALREGASVFMGATPMKVKSFVALQAIPGAAGQGNGATSGGVLARVKFDDGSLAVLRITLDDGVPVITNVAQTGDPVAGANVNLASFGLPTQSKDGRVGFAAMLVPSIPESDTAIFQSNGSDLELVAREGATAIAGNPAVFSRFTALANDSAGRIAFAAQFQGGSSNSASNTALFLQDGVSREVIARKGGQPPGVPTGAKWASFPSLALPDGAAGPIFIGKLVTPAPGRPNPARITAGNCTGVWAVDSTGELQLIVRSGDSFDATRRISALTLLSSVLGSPAQSRSFTDTGDLIYRATLSDGSQHIVSVRIP